MWRIIKKAFLGIIWIIVLALVVGAIYQAVTTQLVNRRYRPEGKLVDIGGRNIHLYCTGQGSPTVVLEAGLGGGSLDWNLVQPGVEKFGRVCSYDRAGMGWSDPAGDDRLATEITEDLHRVLAAAGERGPYVLVGQSIGGIYVQVFAARYPEEVTGVVLVDSTHPDQLSRYPNIPWYIPIAYKSLAPFGVARIINHRREPSPNLSTDVDLARKDLYAHTLSAYAIGDEIAAVSQNMAAASSTPMELRDKPLIVLSRGINEGGSEENEAIWKEMQADLAKRSTIGKLIIAEHSGHYINFFEPELVIDSIREASGG